MSQGDRIGIYNPGLADDGHKSTAQESKQDAEHSGSVVRGTLRLAPERAGLQWVAPLRGTRFMPRSQLNTVVPGGPAAHAVCYLSVSPSLEWLVLTASRPPDASCAPWTKQTAPPQAVVHYLLHLPSGRRATLQSSMDQEVSFAHY